MLNYGLDEPHGWREKKALKQIAKANMSLPSASHSGESCQFLNNKSLSALPQTSVSNHVLTPCHGQGDCPCHSCLPSHSSGGQVIRYFSADSASHLDQGDCSSDLCLQNHFLRMHGICYSPKNSCHPFLFPATNTPLHIPTPPPCGCQSSPAPHDGHWLFSFLLPLWWLLSHSSL